MKRLSGVVVLLVFAVAACHSADGTGDATDSATVINDTTATLPTTDTTSMIDNPAGNSTDSLIQIQFPLNSVSVTVIHELKGIAHPITVLVPVKQGKQLTASIVPDDSTANIRFNQIFFPDGKADGPFGREIKHSINQQGTYRLLIGENLMQGDEWKGKFKLTVKVE